VRRAVQIRGDSCIRTYVVRRMQRRRRVGFLTAVASFRKTAPALQAASSGKVGTPKLVSDLVNGHSSGLKGQGNGHFLAREGTHRHVPQVVD